MFQQTFFCLAAACLVGLIAISPIAAAEPLTYEGMVVSAGGGKLTMKDKAGKDASYTVGTDAKITVNGRPGKLEDLKLGTPIRITSDGTVVIAVSTIDENK